MPSKSHHRAKSALRKPMSDLSNGGYDTQDRFLKKDANQAVESKGSIDRLLVVRSDLSDLISQIDNLVSQAIKKKEIPKKGYQEIESFIGFLSGMCSSLKQWFARLQEALMNTTTVKSKDQVKNRSTPFPLKTKLRGQTNTPHLNVTMSHSLKTPHSYLKSQQTTLTNKTNSKQLDLLVSPSPLVSWRADHCTVVDGGKQLFLLTPLQKSQLQVSKAIPRITPLVNVQEIGTHKKHERTIRNSVQISERERETGFCQTSKYIPLPKTPITLPYISTSKAHERRGTDGTSNARSMSNLRFCSTSKAVLPTKPLPNITGTSTSKNCENNFKDMVPAAVTEHDAGLCGLSNSVLPKNPLTKVTDAAKMHEKHEEIGKPITESVNDLKVMNQKKEVSDTFDWFFSPPKTCVLMEPSAEKKPEELPTPIDKSKRNGDSCEKSLVRSSLYMKATCTKKGEATLKRELWIRFEAASPGDLRVTDGIFQNKDGKGFLDLLDEASS